MKRYANIFFLYSQHVVNFRSRIFIWFLISFLNPISLLIFWLAVAREKGNILSGWNISSISTYYLFLVIASSFIIAHIEEDVAVRDIKEGQLITYLLKPISYYWFKFFDEAPWRMMQGFFGLITFITFFIFFPKIISFPNTLAEIITAVLIIVFAFFISFTFKMIIGLTAFWFVDFWGLQQIVEVILVIFAGSIMPLEFFPAWLKSLALVTPFPYIIYYPIISLESKLNLNQSIHVLSIQIVWLVILMFVYKFLWKKGVKIFTGVGQ